MIPCRPFQFHITSLFVTSQPLLLYRFATRGQSCHRVTVWWLQQVQEEQLSAVVDWLTAQPRAAQLLDKDSSVVSTLEYHLGHYLKDVKRHYVKADKR